MAEDEGSVWVWWVLGQAHWLVEVVQAQCCEYRDDDIVVGEVGVEFLVEREVCAVAVGCAVDAGVGACDWGHGETGQKLDHVTNTLSTTGRVTEGVVVVVLDIERGFETLPFLEGEQPAEGAATEVVGLIGADGLHGISV